MTLQIVLGCLLVLLLTAGTCRAVTLVENGRAGAVIVVPEGVVLPSSAVSEGAQTVGVAALELRDYIEKATGVGLQVKSEGQLAGIDAPENRIYLGPCKEVLETTDVSDIRPDGFVIRAGDSALYIVGRDETEAGIPTAGTLNGVYEFLERYLGVRWLMPGEVGEVVPKTGTVEIGPVDIRQEPLLWQRKVRNVETHGHRDRVREILKEWGISVSEWEAFFNDEATVPWFERQRIGSSVKIRYGHAYGGWWDRYHEAYPDIFARQPDGTRINTNERERLCVSNPDLWDLAAREKVRELRADPQLTAASISPNDGGRNAFCSCERCRAWDSAEARRIYDDDPDSVRPGSRLPLTDRYFRFYNEVGRRVKREVPDRYLGVYAYSLYRTPPENLDHLEDNLLVGYVGFSGYWEDEVRERDRREWLQWGKLAGQLFVRPNLLWGPMGFPVNYVHKLADDLRFMADNGLRAADYDGLIGNWGTQGLQYYALAKLLWDPYADVDAIVEDYCAAAYGRGAGAMRAYYDRLEALTDQIAREGRFTSSRWRNGHVLAGYYTGDVLAELRSHLDSAVRAIGDSDAAAVERARMVATGLEYARQAGRLLTAANDVREGRSTREAFAGVKADVIAYLKSLAMDWSVSVAHNYSYLRRSLGLRRN